MKFELIAQIRILIKLLMYAGCRQEVLCSEFIGLVCIANSQLSSST